MDPTILDSSTDESEIEAREKLEQNDQVSDLDDYSSPKRKTTKIAAIPTISKTLVDLTKCEQFPSSKPNADI